MSARAGDGSVDRMRLRTVLSTARLVALLAVVLLGASGDPGWVRGWAFLAEVALLSLWLEFWLGAVDPELLRQRQLPAVHRQQGRWDRAFMVAGTVLVLGWLALIGADHRFGWSDVPVPIAFAGAVAVAAGFLLTSRVYRHNSFAVMQVRLQADRAQRVIETGPYAVVRHPMYSSSILLFVGASLLLGSWFGLLAAPALVIGMGVRTVGEERMLVRDLPGYAAYRRRVRCRLVPWVW